MQPALGRVVTSVYQSHTSVLMTDSHRSSAGSSRQTLEQQRARVAWIVTPESPDEEYLSVVRGAGAIIMTSGLCQAIAFWLSKDSKAHQRVADALAQWLLRRDEEQQHDDLDATALMDVIRTCDNKGYRHLTSEALAFLQWMKRFAVAESKTS